MSAASDVSKRRGQDGLGSGGEAKEWGVRAAVRFRWAGDAEEEEGAGQDGCGSGGARKEWGVRAAGRKWGGSGGREVEAAGDDGCGSGGGREGRGGGCHLYNYPRPRDATKTRLAVSA